MNKKPKKLILLTVLILVAGFLIFFVFPKAKPENTELQNSAQNNPKNSPESLPQMAIKSLRQKQYPGSKLTIKQTLSPASQYSRYLASYESEELKINGLLTVPKSKAPTDGYPAVIFMHGYIPPDQYSTTESYPTYPARLARQGFVVFKPDLRGHGESEGKPVSTHFSEKYIVDTMNALAALKKHEKVNPNRIGYWGHSNGGEIGLKVAVITSKIKAYSLWAGVVGSYEDMLETYNDQIPFLQDIDSNLVKENGLPSENPEFWQKIDSHFHLQNINAPIQLQHATGDEDVPEELSRSLKNKLEKLDKEVQYFEYEGDNHNIGQNQDKAWQHTITFFKNNL